MLSSNSGTLRALNPAVLPVVARLPLGATGAAGYRRYLRRSRNCKWTALGMIEKLAPPAVARLQELEEMAARLLALARKLPPGQRRYDIMQEIGRFRVRIAAIKGPELGRPHRGPKAKGK